MAAWLGWGVGVTPEGPCCGLQEPRSEQKFSWARLLWAVSVLGSKPLGLARGHVRLSLQMALSAHDWWPVSGVIVAGSWPFADFWGEWQVFGFCSKLSWGQVTGDSHGPSLSYRSHCARKRLLMATQGERGSVEKRRVAHRVPGPGALVLEGSRRPEGPPVWAQSRCSCEDGDGVLPFGSGSSAEAALASS